MVRLLIDAININTMKKSVIKTGLLVLAGSFLFSGCTQQMADNYASNNGHPNSEKMFMDLSKDKELATELSKYWNITEYNKNGITVIKEANIVNSGKLENFNEKFYPALEKSKYPKEYLSFVAKRGNTVKKYNFKISSNVFTNADQKFYLDNFFQNTLISTKQPIGNIYIEFDKDGRIISALGTYYYRYGELSISVDAFHTYFSGETAKKIERIVTKKELEDNLAF